MRERSPRRRERHADENSIEVETRFSVAVGKRFSIGIETRLLVDVETRL